MKLPRRTFLHLAASAAAPPGRVTDRKCANLSDAGASHQGCSLNPLADHREDRCYREERAITT
jgi:hypothetical protein